MRALRRYLQPMQILEHFEIVELGDKFTVVDRSVSPGRTMGVYDTWEIADQHLEQFAVVPEPWLQDRLLLATAIAISERQEIPFSAVVRRLEELGPDAMWLLVNDGLELVARAAGLSDDQ